MVKKDGQYWLSQVSNSDLLSDARGYRRGVNYAGGAKAKAEIDKEIRRRKKLGLISKRAGGTKVKARTSAGKFPTFRF